MGFHSFPNFMYENNINEISKIILFNALVAQIEKDEKPDIIIVGIPGGIMKLNDTITNKFGIFAYEVSQAINPDLVIFSTIYQNFKPEYFKMVNNLLKFRLGYEADYFNISISQFDWDNSFQSKQENYLTTLPDFIDKKIVSYKNVDIPVFNIFNQVDRNNISKNIIERLEDYGQIEII